MQRQSRPQDISWFLEAHRNNQLNLAPSYQRKSVWTPKDRRGFLDTIFRNYPCPAIFLHKEVRDGKSYYNVVDGKQRLETIIGFASGAISIDKEYGDTRLSGKKWDKLDDTLKKQFWNYVLPVEWIDVTEDTTLNDAFARLNRNSRKLERQEIRHSQFSGWFISFVENEANESAWKTLQLSSSAAVRRMKDHQFLAELLLVVIENKIHGFDQDELDEKHAFYDDLEDAELQHQESNFRDRFSSAKQFILEMEKENGCIGEYASTAGHFYTLWAWVVLERSSQTVQDTAKAYDYFMKEVLIHSKDPSIRKSLTGNFSFEDIVEYFNNSTRATTELPQRTKRQIILNKALT